MTTTIYLTEEGKIMLEKVKNLWAQWKVQISVVGGALVVATAYGSCTFEAPAVEEPAVEEAATTGEDAPAAVETTATESTEGAAVTTEATTEGESTSTTTEAATTETTETTEQ